MNIYQAALDTMEVIEKQKPIFPDSRNPSMSIKHMRGMMDRWPVNGSEAKQGRWLGWLQASAVAKYHPDISLDTVKLINLANSKDEGPVPADDSGALDFIYTNYKGETRLRRATPVRYYQGATEYHTEKQWLMCAFDHEKGAFRDFAVSDCSFGVTAAEVDLHKEIARQSALLEGRYADVKFVSFQNGQLDLEGSVVEVIAEQLAQVLSFREEGPTSNYVETQVSHPEVGEIIVTIQRNEGKTPHQFAKEAEAKVDAVREAIKPVIDWFQSDEQNDKPLEDIVSDIVAELQSDREQNLAYARAERTRSAEGDTPDMGGMA